MTNSTSKNRSQSEIDRQIKVRRVLDIYSWWTPHGRIVWILDGTLRGSFGNFDFRSISESFELAIAPRFDLTEAKKKESRRSLHMRKSLGCTLNHHVGYQSIGQIHRAGLKKNANASSNARFQWTPGAEVVRYAFTFQDISEKCSRLP